MKRDITQLLEMARDCELKVSQLYRAFANQFSENDQARDFWDALSDDEIEHAKFIEQLSGELPAEIKSKAPERSQWYPVEHLLQYIKNNPPDSTLSVRGAAAYTDKLENYEVTSIVQLMSEEYMPEDKRNELLSRQLADHYCKAEEFIRKTLLNK